jgi:hypothetical protein
MEGLEGWTEFFSHGIFPRMNEWMNGRSFFPTGEWMDGWTEFFSHSYFPTGE